MKKDTVIKIAVSVVTIFCLYTVIMIIISTHYLEASTDYNYKAADAYNEATHFIGMRDDIKRDSCVKLAIEFEKMGDLNNAKAQYYEQLLPF